MYKYHNKSKRFLATALITTGLLGTTPLMSEEIIQFERLPLLKKTFHYESILNYEISSFNVLKRDLYSIS